MRGAGGGLQRPALAVLDRRGRDRRWAAAAGPRRPRQKGGLQRPALAVLTGVGGTGGGLLRPALAALDGSGRDRQRTAHGVLDWLGGTEH